MFSVVGFSRRLDTEGPSRVSKAGALVKLLRTGLLLDRPILLYHPRHDVPSTIRRLLREWLALASVEGSELVEHINEAHRLLRSLMVRQRFATSDSAFRLLDSDAFIVAPRKQKLDADPPRVALPDVDPVLEIVAEVSQPRSETISRVSSSDRITELRRVVSRLFGKLLATSTQIILCDQYIGSTDKNFGSFGDFIYALWSEFASRCPAGVTGFEIVLVCKFDGSKQATKYLNQLRSHMSALHVPSGTLSAGPVAVRIARVHDALMGRLHDRFIVGNPHQTVVQVGRGFDWKAGTDVNVCLHVYTRSLLTVVATALGGGPLLRRIDHI